MLGRPPHGLCHCPLYQITPSLDQLDKSQVALNDCDILLNVKVATFNSITYRYKHPYLSVVWFQNKYYLSLQIIRL